MCSSDLSREGIHKSKGVEITLNIFSTQLNKRGSVLDYHELPYIIDIGGKASFYPSFYHALERKLLAYLPTLGLFFPFAHPFEDDKLN